MLSSLAFNNKIALFQMAFKARRRMEKSLRTRGAQKEFTIATQLLYVHAPDELSKVYSGLYFEDYLHIVASDSSLTLKKANRIGAASPTTISWRSSNATREAYFSATSLFKVGFPRIQKLWRFIRLFVKIYLIFLSSAHPFYLDASSRRDCHVFSVQLK